MTIDYGDGRTLERTITGNSAHYVLDEDGHVLDVLPGLYAPIAFRRELEDSLRLAGRMRGKSDEERRMLLVAYHQQLADATQRAWERLPGTPWIAGERRLLSETRLRTELAAAERATFAKAAMELRDLRHFAKGLAPEAVPEDQTEMWSAAGQVLYNVGDHVLDEASRALIVRLHDAVPGGLRTTAAQTDAMIARLEQSIVADSALNQLRLRPQISREIVRRGGHVDFPALNGWLYAQVFRTPRQDPWLGLLPRDVFTGLPGDGLVDSK